MSEIAPIANAPPPPRSSMRRDLASAYLVTAARVGGWVIVSAAVFRRVGAEALGLLTLVRATIGVLSYTSLGLGPAVVRLLTLARAPQPVAALPDPPRPADGTVPSILPYAGRTPASAWLLEPSTIYESARTLAGCSAIAAMILTFVYATFAGSITGHTSVSSGDTSLMIFGFGAGISFRMLSEVPSGLLQAENAIALDNLLLAASDALWALLTYLLLRHTSGGRASHIVDPGAAFFISSAVLWVARTGAAWSRRWERSRPRFQWSVAHQLLAFGSLIVLAQVADFLYAPTDCILITHLIGPTAVAYYSPAIQIDAGLLMLVSGLGAVLFPKSALAHANENYALVRRYYVHGTLASIALLLPAAALVCLFSSRIFKGWFGDSMPATRAILPLILIHTVVGGSSAVGRSILLGMGKVKPFTISVLIAGVSNVILSYAFVRYFNLGLPGIVYGTIVVVVARCAIWMPWYVLHSLRDAENPARSG